MNDRFIETLTEEERAVYDSYTKEQVYEAYMSEQLWRVRLNKQLNEERRKAKEIEWKLSELMKLMRSGANT